MREVHNVPLHAADFDFSVRVYPAPEASGDVLVWLHGGMFMFGTIDMPESDHVARRLRDMGITVVAVDYTLAPLDALSALPRPEPREGGPTLAEMQAAMDAAGPRSQYPVASLQAVAAFDWAVQNAKRFGGSPDRVALGGASAGANLAAGAAVRLRDRATAVPCLVALVYPVLHAELPPFSADLERALAEPPAEQIPSVDQSAALNRNYAGDHVDTVYAFPGGHDMTGLSPTLIVTARRDVLRSSGEAFAAELALVGVDVSLVCERAARHGFHNVIGDPASESTIRLLARRLVAMPAGAEASLG